ncbi:MAG: PKD domain-containing protein, partial [Cytophagales bacterium]
DPLSGCGPLTVTFKDLSVGFDSTYTWNFGNNTTSNSYIVNDTNIVYQPGIITDTVYYVTLNVKNQCKPQGDEFRDSIIVLPQPLANFGTDKSVGCSPAPFNFNNLSLGRIKNSPTTYYWKFSDGQQTVGPQQSFLINGTMQEPHPGTKYFTYIGNNDTTYNITLIASNLCGIDSITKSIKVLPNTVRAFFNQSVNDGCSPLNVMFTDFSTGGNFVSYDFGDGNSIVAKNHSHTFNNTGTVPQSFTVKQFVNNGCSYDTTEQTITVNPIPKVDFSIFKNELCQFEESVFNNLSTGVDHSIWDFGDGTPEFSNILSQVRHVYDTAGVFNVRLIGKENRYLCADTVIKTIQVNAPPSTDFSLSDTAGCQPFTLQLNNNSSADAQNFLWRFGDGNTSTLVNPNHVYLDKGVFQIKLYARNNKGCSDSTLAKVEVYETPIADFVIANETDPCSFPINLTLENRSSSVANGFSWLLDGVQVSTLNNPIIALTQAKTYVIDLVASSNRGCSAAKRVEKRTYPLPIANFTFADSTGCTPHEVTFTNLSQHSEQYEWKFGTGSKSNNSQSSVKHLYPVGSYQVTLIAKSPVGCIDSLVTVPSAINVKPKPVADFSFEPNIIPELYGTIIFTDQSFDAVAYNWDMGDGTIYNHDSLIFSHRFQLFGDKTIKLKVTNEFGCSDTILKSINVPFFGNLFVPSAFSPGRGDDMARIFKPVGIGLETYKVQVFDMWGILVWESDKIDANTMPEEGWDGTKNGFPLTQDAYVWKVEATFKGGRSWPGMEYKKGKFKTTGTVTLLR